ncbi:MAG: homocysteine S-methyltransferase family protein [Desulfovermiculus sp.]
MPVQASLEAVLATHELVLMEAAVSELLVHSFGIPTHPQLGCAPCIYHQAGRRALKRIYGGFLALARESGVPLLITAPTWRANKSVVQAVDCPQAINQDAVRFMQGVRHDLGQEMTQPVLIGGLLGPLRDAYRPDLAVDEKSARQEHSWQAEALAQAGADYLMAATLPAVEEAAGLAQAMAQTGLPFMVSFVIDKQGRILDGSSLDRAIQEIDAHCSSPPSGYMINCSYPSFLRPEKEPARVLSRLIGYQANASSLEHSALDNSGVLQADAVEDWGEGMLTLHRHWGLKILGGCCGTGDEHLRYLVQNRTA